MKHAILIIAHDNIPYLLQIIDYFDDDFKIYIHLDKKKNFSKYEISLLKNKINVVLVSQKYKTNWGGFNILKAELYLMKKALMDDYTYFHLISGQDYPTKSILEFKLFFEQNNGNEFIEYKKLPREEWENGTFKRYEYFRPLDYFDYRTPRGYKIINNIIDFQSKRRLYKKIPNHFDSLYGGSAWFSLTKNAVQYILDYTTGYPVFYNELKYTFAPEETYIPTILAHSPFNEHLKNNNLRYIDWKYRNNSFPAILDESDFFKILETDAIFARKVISSISNCLIDKLDYRITHSKFDDKIPFNIQESGSWQKKDFKGYCYDRELGEALCLFSELMEVNTIVDLGCGTGWYVKTLKNADFTVDGFDGNPYTEYLSNIIMQDGAHCYQLDLAKEIRFKEKYDMVLSLEVGEYIPEKFENIYISNLVNNCKSYLVMSWAIEGQKQDGHINCRKNEYIIDKIKKAGFVENIPLKNYLRNIAELQRFKETLFVFQKI